ncbi:MAG: hypothetical protein ACOX8Q_08520 [Christensenellales bacterium]
MDVFLGVIILALLIEKLAETVKAIISPSTLPGWAWFLITAAMGMLLCVIFRIDMFGALGFTGGTAAATITGQLFTGIAAGSGSNFVHDLIDRLKAKKIGS